MTRRFSPFWWPVFAITSPVLGPWLALRHGVFSKNKTRADAINQKRLAKARSLPLPELKFLEITPLVEWKTEPDFKGDPGVSYLIRTDRGAVLFDLGFGGETDVLEHNARRLGISWSDVDALVVSHLHMDHMGGVGAVRKKQIALPPIEDKPGGMTCYLPDEAQAPDFSVRCLEEPALIEAGLGTTGPLARSLFLMGWCEEQVLLARLKGKGLVLITGCGHPGLDLIFAMAKRLSPEPVHALAGGLHYPVTESRLKRPGLEAVMVFGTGKPPWQRITDHDLDRGIESVNKTGLKRLLLSAHDTCDHALERFSSQSAAECQVLKAGGVYRL